MALYASPREGEEEDELASAINTTPLVDVMLVLLIIFLITIPVVTHSVPLQLPKDVTQPRQTKPENVNIAITKEGDLYWNEQLVQGNQALLQKLKKVSVLTPQPAVELRADQEARYEFVGRLVLACQRAGILKIGFIVEPPPRGG
ncbi:MAG TPA: biopolymer transporter ExbD [Burkholderiales bacterium]|nr:biopolymer transporter ExbD [Burkholderiales bacterium]